MTSDYISVPPCNDSVACFRQLIISWPPDFMLQLYLGFIPFDFLVFPFFHLILFSMVSL